MEAEDLILVTNYGPFRIKNGGRFRKTISVFPPMVLLFSYFAFAQLALAVLDVDRVSRVVPLAVLMVAIAMTWIACGAVIANLALRSSVAPKKVPVPGGAAATTLSWRYVEPVGAALLASSYVLARYFA